MSNTFLKVLFFVITYKFLTYGLKCPGQCIEDTSSCRLLGGKILGYCKSEKACCDFSENPVGSCGYVASSGSNKVAYFKSPSYPKPSSGDLVCQFDLELGTRTLGVRIDFIEMQLDTLPSDLSLYAESLTPICESDILFIKGFKNWTPDSRCGNFTGYSLLVESEKDQKKLTLLFIMSSAAYKWNIRLTQLSENDVNTMHALVYNKMTFSDKRQITSSIISNTAKKTPQQTLAGSQKSASYYSDYNYNYNSMKTPEHFSQNEMKSLEQFEIDLIKPVPRIAGGENAEEYSIPWQVSIQSVTQFESFLCGTVKNMSVHLCGGSIIDEKTILTSAHCFYSPSRYPHPIVAVEDLKVVVGELDMCKSDEVAFTKQFDIAQIILHFNYFSKDIVNDLAVVKLKQAIDFNQGVGPVRLADTDFVLSQNTSTLLSGWGSYNLDENATFPSILQKTLELVILPEEECEKRQRAYLNYKIANNASSLFGKYEGVFAQGICARGKNEEVEAGFGDSGGPLVAIENRKGHTSTIPTLVGVVSHMRSEREWDTNATFHLDYFVKVSAFKKWILMGMI